jgi:hypothetical protein
MPKPVTLWGYSGKAGQDPASVIEGRHLGDRFAFRTDFQMRVPGTHQFTKADRIRLDLAAITKRSDKDLGSTILRSEER